MNTRAWYWGSGTMQVGNPADFLGAKKNLDSPSLKAVMGEGLTYDIHWESHIEETE